MSLNWLWSERCGEIIAEGMYGDGQWHEYTLRLYKGNAFLIMLSENDEDNTYTVSGFFVSKDHAKNCLGLDKKDKDSYNIYQQDHNRWKKVRLNKAKYPYTKDLTTMLVQAFDHIEIEIYNDPKEGEQNDN